MKAIATCFALTALVVAAAAAPLDQLKAARQLVLVVTPGWDDVRGELRRFERRATGETWRAVGAPASIVVGKNGSDRKSTRLNSSHVVTSRMPSSA